MMVQRLMIAALLSVPVCAGAHSSHQDWVWGTRAYETVTPLNFDLELRSAFSRFPDSSVGWGHFVGVETGLSGRWSAAANLRYDALGNWDPAARSRFRFLESGVWPLDFALAVEWDRYSGQDEVAGGLVVARELGNHSLVFNGFASRLHEWDLRAAWRTPFFVYALRMGLEGRWLADSAESGVGPQVSLVLPGDLSFTLGSWFPLQANGRPWSLVLRIDYTHFPAP